MDLLTEQHQNHEDGSVRMGAKHANYYEARGFSVYYFANAVFNVASSPILYLRGIEEILGDMKSEFLMQPFNKYTNLHEFIRCVVLEIIVGDVRNDDNHLRLIKGFLNLYDVECQESNLDCEDAFAEFMYESRRFHEAIDECVEEVFHVLFNDIGFLQAFNRLCAGYIQNSGFGQQFCTSAGTLKRVAIPVWVRRSIFHRDKGECRSCKRSLAAIINGFDTERYDHIVPLARFGANDLTNLQLLCDACNLKKSAQDLPVSRLYHRAAKL